MAKQRIIELLSSEPSITIKTHMDSAGKFGRILGELFVNGSDISINDMLIHEKLAVEYTGAAKVSFEENVARGHLVDLLCK